MDEIKISMVAPAIVYFPVLIAQRRGQFTANGIVATTEVTGATDKVTSALKANDCQVAMVTPEGVIADAAQGGRLRLVAGNANKAPLSLIGLKSMNTIEDLRGEKVGTSSLKEGTAILVQKMLAAHKLRYPGDYDFALVGAHPQRWDALQKGAIAAGLQLVPYDYIAEEAGYPNLGAVRDYVPDYAFTAIAVDRQWADANRDIVKRTLSAMRQATEWAVANIDEAAGILAEEWHLDVDHAKRALGDLFDHDVTPRDLHIDPKALDAVFDVMLQARLVPAEVPLSYERAVDESFL
jgi:ABC-type nitrate/sulfonate/bicarbonate transport system substrate-binding protein